MDPAELGIKKGHEPRIYDVIAEKVFNSKMMEIFQGSDLEELIQCILAHIKSQIENPALSKNGFTLDSKMYLDISFQKPVLTQESS